MAIPTLSFTPRFCCGELVLTAAVRALIERRQLDPRPFFARHLSADWGDLKAEDWSRNRQALSHEGTLKSGYQISRNVRLVIVTEPDRSMTTLYLADECPLPTQWREFLA